MLISVAVPSLNSEKYLHCCLSSILTNPHVEVILQDGGSTDETLCIAEMFQHAFKGRVRIYTGKDKNEPDAINKAWSHARGDMLAWLDTDDMYYDLVVPQADWVIGKCRIIDGVGRETRSLITQGKNILLPHYSKTLLETICFIPQPACFISRRAYEAIGLLNTDEKLVFDYDYWLRLSRKYKPVFVNKYLAAWRAHEASPSVLNFRKEAHDARRVAGNYTANRFVHLAQHLAYYGTTWLYGRL